MPPITIEIKANTDDAQRDLRAMTQELDDMKSRAAALSSPLGKTSSGIDSLKQAGSGAKRSLVELKAGIDLAGQAIDLIGQGFDATVKKAADWGDEMGDLAQLTGTTVKETSTLAATFELLGIKQDGLTKVVKAFTAQGLQPTMANVRALAAEYQAIQDPVEKNEWLFKRFGRQASDVAEVLGKSTDELDQFTAAARRSGKVIDEETAEAAEKLNVQLAIFEQKAEGAAIALGNLFIPTLNKALVAGEQLFMIWQMGNVRLRELRGEIDGETAALEMQRIAGIEPATEATEDLNTTTEDLTRSTSSLSAESERWAGMAEVAAQAAERKAAIDRIAATDAQNYAQAQRDAVQALADLQAKQDGWASSTGQDVINALNDAGVKGREYEAALIAIDQQLGTSFANDAEKKNKLDDLTQSYADGKIGVDEYKAGLNLLYAEDMPKTQAAFAEARDRAGELDDKLTRLEGRRVQMFVETVYTELRAAAGGIHDTATGDLKQTTPLGGGRAAGGPVSEGQAYIVGEKGPELFVPTGNGYIVPNTEINVGGITINGAGQPVTTAAAVRAELERMGRQADTRIRTR